MMKPTKTHAEARRAHLALQARRDALAKMRAGEVVMIRLAADAGGQLVKARAVPSDWAGKDMLHGLYVLAVINRRLRVDVCVESDGLRVGQRRLDYKDILGIVLEINGKNPYPSPGPYWDAMRAKAEGTFGTFDGASPMPSSSPSPLAIESESK